MWEPDKSFYVRECACVGVCVYLSGITHSFQTCLSSTLVCVRECVRVCTSECEIPLSVLKPSLAYCLLRERERERLHARSYHTCVHVCFSVQACVCVCVNLCSSFWRSAMSGDGANFQMYTPQHQCCVTSFTCLWSLVSGVLSVPPKHAALKFILNYTITI